MSITTPCPECKKPLVTEGEGEGSFSFRVDCKHCEKPIKVKIEKVTKVSAFPHKTLLVLLIPIYLYMIIQAWNPIGKVAQVFREILNEYAINEK